VERQRNPEAPIVFVFFVESFVMEHPQTTAIRTTIKELYTAVGAAIIAWGKLEIRIDEFLFSMLSHPKAKTSKIPKSFGARLKLCNELAPLFYRDGELDEVRALTKTCRGQYRTRNRLAHGEWMLSLFRTDKPRPPQIMSRVRRHGLRGQERNFSIKQIEGLTRKYRELGNRIHDFHYLNHPEGPPVEQLKRFFDSLADDSKRRSLG
jgi:hypothetical protein